MAEEREYDVPVIAVSVARSRVTVAAESPEAARRLAAEGLNTGRIYGPDLTWREEGVLEFSTDADEDVTETIYAQGAE